MKSLMYFFTKGLEVLCPTYSCSEIGIFRIELELDTMI
jgi:hypothetical protein